MPEDRDLARESTGSPSASARGVLTVSALNRSVRDLLEHRYPPLWISGEISNFTAARSGHHYFVLKDAQSQVRCVMFKHRNQYLAWKPRDGDHVEVHALATFYEPRGEFQLTVETMRQAGVGALFEQFIRLRDRLEKEGLFSNEIKRALPVWPRTIGIITSLKAAALRDILTTLSRRNPGIGIVIYPVTVQGDRASGEIAAALDMAGERSECDVLILARGGGSIEDLWAFNDERVARAIRTCPIPVISGIGHETDFTIADFAADRRAPTPTAAAEMASPDREDARRAVRTLLHRLQQRMNREVESRMQRLDGLTRRLEHPGRRLETRLAILGSLQGRLNAALQRGIESRYRNLGMMLHRSRAALPRPEHYKAAVESVHGRLRAAARANWLAKETRLGQMRSNLDHLNPQRVLERGYSVARTDTGEVVIDATQVRHGDTVSLTFASGGATTTIMQTHPDVPPFEPAA
jgi:exodeoxyribonuclease VII large subunit